MPTFPSYEVTGRRPARFRQLPIDWRQITEDYEYEDGGHDFNEVADAAPQRWEYELTGLTQAEADYYDAFFNSVRFTVPFTFTDKWGTIWTDVRIEEYERNHDGHKSWIHSVSFRLVSYTGATTAVPITPTGLVVLFTTDTTATLDWDDAPLLLGYGANDLVYNGDHLYYQS